MFVRANVSVSRFLHHTIDARLLTPNLVSSVLFNMRAAVFPNNSLGPASPPPPSLEEQAQIRHRAARCILDLIPSVIARHYWATDDEEEILEQIEADILDVFGDRYMNKHLMYGMLELILVRLIPELESIGMGELLAERGVAFGEQRLAVDNENNLDFGLS